MSDLAQKKCTVCEVGDMSLEVLEVKKLMGELNGWTLSPDSTSIYKRWKFSDFASGMVFANKIATLADAEGHHPELSIGWGFVLITLTTHSVGGLSENDFIFAAKIASLE